MNWKNAFNIYKGERIALIVLLVLIVITIIVNIVLSSMNKTDIQVIQNPQFEKEYAEFHKQLKEKEKTSPNYSTQKKYQHQEEETYYDNKDSYKPNTSYVRQEKFAAGEYISLNEKDTAQWKKVPGIGSSFAARIVKYGDLLGGYSSINQLHEVYGMQDELFNKIKPFISLSNTNTEKMDVNKSEFKQLLNHPYLEYPQVKAIFNIRNKKGKVESLEQLSLLEEFTDKDIERLRPYLKF